MIVVAGEALMDLVAEGPEGGDRYVAVPGGSPANVALGLARLDAPVAMLARFSRDAFGARLREHLRGNGVRLDLAVVDAAEVTPLAVATISASGSASYAFYVSDTADRQWRPEEVPEALPDEVDALCLGSFALVLEPGASLLAALFERERRRGRATIVLDPNVRPVLMGEREPARARMERLVGLSHVVKVSDEDLAWLHPDLDPLDAARRWVGLGPQLVVVTRGRDGVVALTSSGTELAVPAHPVDVVDTVGAGDAFCSALVDGLRRAGALGGGSAAIAALPPDALAAVLERAALASGLTCARRGADPPTAAELTAAATP